tara:strand:- start:24458 stop:25237 length:780 start_codon:yes stop_codon:yes gene_type:complete
MKSLKDYLQESHQLHEYVVRFVEKPSDVDMDTIEAVLKKFDLRDITTPQRIQNSDLDFFDIPYREIYEVRLATAVRLSPYMLLQDLRSALNISEKNLRVRGAQEPQQLYAEHQEWLSDVAQQAHADGLTHQASLSTNREYMSQEQPLNPPAFGDDYNKSLLAYLNNIAQNRDPGHVDTGSQLFGWLDMNNATTDKVQSDDFNKNFDTTKPQQKPNDKMPIAPWLSQNGTFTIAAQPTISAWQDKKSAPKIQVQPRKGAN